MKTNRIWEEALIFTSFVHHSLSQHISGVTSLTYYLFYFVFILNLLYSSSPQRFSQFLSLFGNPYHLAGSAMTYTQWTIVEWKNEQMIFIRRAWYQGACHHRALHAWADIALWRSPELPAHHGSNRWLRGGSACRRQRHYQVPQVTAYALLY